MVRGLALYSMEWGVLKRQKLLNFRFIQTFCIIANQVQALGVHNIKIMMTKWLQKRNCRVVKLPQVPVRLYADIYFILIIWYSVCFWVRLTKVNIFVSSYCSCSLKNSSYSLLFSSILSCTSPHVKLWFTVTRRIPKSYISSKLWWQNGYRSETAGW
jgi:hypothetical protein